MPNIPEMTAAFFATAARRRLVVLARFRVGSAVDRFAQIEPKVLLAVDGYRYGGK